MKRFSMTYFLPVLLGFTVSAQPLYDIGHYAISLDISDVSSHRIQGCCTVQLKSNADGLEQITLDLLELTVDSVMINNAAAAFSYNDTVLNITLPQALHQNDVAGIRICYHGQPVEDATWGGFYFSGDYAYNMGVGFASNPHTLGKVWFPCVDNFTDKATFDFYITTHSLNKAFCNGLLKNVTTEPNGNLTWHWEMNEPIPAYLASVAVAPYAALYDNYVSITGNTIPVILAARASDTSRLKSSFIHLPDAFNIFEQSFGPYLFDRVGYVLVPFSGGAMEHATNISYASALVNGGLEYETTMAHEFSHHWWGDLVTCTTAEDMWLNEGWAVYSEKIFLEKLYGKNAYRKGVRANHMDVLQFAHIHDDGYRAVSGVPHDYTYGKTVYDKGADVAHTLRGYMGDSLFFTCIQSFLDAYKFGNASSENFRDYLTACSGINLNSFFDNWVFAPGFPHFSIDSFFVVQGANGYDVTVFIRQRLKAAPGLYSDVPVELTFLNEDDSITLSVMFSGDCGIYRTTLDFEPAFVALDMNEKISDAITDKFYHIGTAGTYDFEEAMMTLIVTGVPSEALVRVEHHWIAPDPKRDSIAGLHISDERYWKVDGLIPDGFAASARVAYDGTAGNGYLDQRLITNSEDSLVILYRPDKQSDWELHPDFAINTQGSAANKRGQITINRIAKGEYALGIWDHHRPVADSQAASSPCFALGMENNYGERHELQFEIFPNPANDSFYIRFSKFLTKDVSVAVYDLAGKPVVNFIGRKGEDKLMISTKGWNKSGYLVTVSATSGQNAKKVVIVEVE